MKRKPFLVDNLVWEMMQNGIEYVHSILKFTQSKDVLDEYIQKLVQKFYEVNNNIDIPLR